MTSAGGTWFPRWGAVVLTLALTACGSSSKPPSKVAASRAPGATSSAGSQASSPSGSFDVCRLVTRDEAQAAVRTTLQAGIHLSRQSATGLQGSCRYLSSNASQKSVVNVVLLGTKFTRAQYDLLVGAKRGPASRQVAGLGETAVYNPAAGAIGVFDRGIWLALQIFRDDRSVPPLAVMTRLAGKALRRLGRAR